MNEHMWRKCGEVKAFAEVGIEMLKRGKPALRDDVFSADEIEELIAANRTHRDQLDQIAKSSDMLDVMNEKAEATQTKLETLQDDYLTDKDDWKDPHELLEWAGFFHGGAIVHWSLIVGAAQSADHQKLLKLGEGGRTFHQEVLNAVDKNLERLGSTA